MNDEEKFGFKIGKEKFCTGCRKHKDRENDFHKNLHSWDGRNGFCKECHLKRTKKNKVAMQQRSRKSKWDLD